MPVGFLGAAEVSNPPRHWVQGVRRAFKGRFESLPAIAGGMTGICEGWGWLVRYR